MIAGGRVSAPIVRPWTTHQRMNHTSWRSAVARCGRNWTCYRTHSCVYHRTHVGGAQVGRGRAMCAVRLFVAVSSPLVHRSLVSSRNTCCVPRCLSFAVGTPQLSAAMDFPLSLRVPAWAAGASVTYRGQTTSDLPAGAMAKVAVVAGSGQVGAGQMPKRPLIQGALQLSTVAL